MSKFCRAPDQALPIIAKPKQMELTAEVLITNFEELEAIKERSQTMGIAVEVSDASAEQNRVRARLIGTYL